ncbi:MAG: branched-chain amino acid ABC transporter permease [Rhodospirillaceae bacterium]|nr:branched-chain amino acid ABC transporter permease [Rhodospirillaceae bacterium]MBT4428716.1 branched-chain amino acid ABC transporter permease [Rhodospirillaceae bacterium]MBT5040099.1 branched-chain amino acid ABC transporter permease [Rhodospirillaceae bacterium]
MALFWKHRDFVIFAILLGVALAFPFMGIPRFILAAVLIMYCYATVVSQWNLVFGLAGIFSLAQVAIFAFGAYSTALLGRYLEMNLWYSFPIAGLGGILFSFLIGLACLRLRGIYVALLTLAVSQMMFVLIQTDAACSALNKAINPMSCVSFTGGSQGLGDFGSFGWRAVLGGRNWMTGDYYTMLGLLVIGLIVTYLITQSRMGLAFRALRDNEELARSRGISQYKYQLLVFGASAFLTAAAGGFYAAHFGAVGINLFGFPLLLFLISMLVVGGIGRLWGPLLGAALLMSADEVFKEFSDWRNVGLGIVVLLFMIFLPDGLAGGIDKLHKLAVRVFTRSRTA